MKHYKKILLAAVVSMMAIACTDKEFFDYVVDKPESLIGMEYLNQYDALKNYVNRAENPDFKLGTGITVSDFLKKGLVYKLACSNYDDLTAGNAMKYSSCVSDNGSMDFSQVAQFVGVARDAGLSIYGHTLCWHSQQNNKYLNGLIAPEYIESDNNVLDLSGLKSGSLSGWGANGTISVEEGAGINGGNAVKLVSSSTASAPWNLVLTIPAITIESGIKYNASFRIKSDKLGRGRISFSNALTSQYPYMDWTGSGSSTEYFETGDTWMEVKFPISGFVDDASSYTFSFDLGYLPDVTYYIDVNTLTVEKTDENAGLEENLYQNSDFEGDVNLWVVNGTGVTMDFTANGQGSGGAGRALKVTNATVKDEAYGAQFWYRFDPRLKIGDKYEFSMDIRADVETTFGSQYHHDTYAYNGGGIGNVDVTTSWQTIKKTITIEATQDVGALVFDLGKTATTFYFDNMSIRRVNPNAGSSTVEKTPEEKKEILTGALETWIKGMLEACDGYVKAWDVVNEPMSDSNPYDLKSDPSGTDTENFYWQDYLGKDYARVAIKFARQYGGDGMKLFINDYNLEAWYNNNEKCKGLINMINYWESDGETVIDGIATQMHVSYNMDPEKQRRQEECIVKMYELMAASGKLIKVSELDMGILDASGNAIKTVDLTNAQQLLMSEFYQFIVKKYFEIIPANQRYGISHWSATDSPDDQYSFWRRGEPIGLWTLDYNRKHAYAGFANGLAGRDITKDK